MRRAIRPQPSEARPSQTMFNKVFRLFIGIAILAAALNFQTNNAQAAATDAPIIVNIGQGTSGQLTVYMAPYIEGTENTWFFQVINNDAGCANPYGNSATSNTSGAPTSFNLTGLTDGCKYQINVANWNGATSPYTTVYAIPGVSKSSSDGYCTTYAAVTTYLNISSIGTNECLISITTTGQNVRWVPNYGLSTVQYLAVGGGGAGSRGECGIFWGAGGGGGEVLANSSLSITSSLWMNVGAGGASNSSQACPGLNGTGYTTANGTATTIGTTSGGVEVANARGGGGVTVNPVANNAQGGKGGNNGNPSYTGYQYPYYSSCASNGCAAGGGGGASASSTGLNGGAGVTSSINGTTQGYGGGGAGKYDTGFGSASDGGSNGTLTAASTATANRGGGGSDSSNYVGYVGGGSGVIYIRYSNRGLTPVFDKPAKTSTGFTINILNYDSNYTWATPTVSSGTVAVTGTIGTKRKLTVSGLSAGSSATLTQATSRTGFTTVSATSTTTSLTNQSSLTISSTSGTFGTNLSLTTSGGSGTGAVSYSLTSAGTAGCSLSTSTLSATSAGTCSVTATKAADDTYNAVSSTATTITFGQATQSTLTISSTSGTAGVSLTLTTTGGSGTGAVTFAVTTAGTANCSVSGSTLSASAYGTCTVTATKASDSNYLSASSSATTITFSSQLLSNAAAPSASATANTLKSIDVSWTTVSNASSYTLKLYASNGTSLLATITSLTTLSRTITASDYASIADATVYKVSITAIGTGNYSSSSESSLTSVTTNSPAVTPTISSQPTNASISSGATASFSVTASVSDSGTITYQWQVSTNSGSTWSNVSSGSGGTSANYTTAANTYSNNNNQFKVIVTNSKNGSTATTTSSVATLSVGAAATTITISLPGGATSATYNSAVTITASTSVNGSVNFKLAGTTITGCGSVSTTSLAATCSWTPATTGSNALTAVLTPSDTNNYANSTSATVTVNVGTGPTTTTITIDIGTPEYLVAKNITATTSVAGTVNFMFNGKTIPGCFAKATNGSLQAVCSWRPGVRGPVSITATLSPTDSAYAPSTSSAVIATVAARSGAHQ